MRAKKLFVAILLLLTTLSCTLYLVACDNSDSADNDHTHSFSTWKTTTTPTCTAQGTQTRVCTSCGFAEYSSIPLIAHTEVIDAAVSATCMAEGKTQGKHCSVCNTVTLAQTTIPAPGHTEVIDSAVAATCTTDGKTQGKHCSVCNTVTTPQIFIFAPGHTDVVDAAVVATCTVDGKTQGKHCSTCGTVTLAQTVIPAPGHTEVIDAAVSLTCTVNGKTQGKHCSVCNSVIVPQIITSAPGHTVVIDAAVNLTCTTDGKTMGKHCSKCQTIIIPQSITPAPGHSWTNWETITEPKMEKKGMEKRTCTTCLGTETRDIPPLNEDTTLVWFLNQYKLAKKQYINALELGISNASAEIKELENEKLALNATYQKEIKYIIAQYGSSYSTGMLETALKNAENRYESALKVYNDEITILENEIKLLNKELSKPNIDNILLLVMERCNISSKETYEYYYKYSKYLT